MPGTNVILDHLLLADMVQLGSLITSVKYPEHDFCRLDHPATDAETTSTRVLDFTYGAERLKGSGFHTALTALLSRSQSRKNEQRIDISSATCTTQQLRDSTAFFETFCHSSRRARAWLERAIRKRQTVYSVTGVKTVTDAKIGSERATGGDVSADVTLPTALVASSAAGVPLPLDGGALDVGAGVSASWSSSESTSFVSPGEKIFAIQCRKVRFSFFASRDVDSAALADGARWNIFLGERGEGEVDEETVNAALSESVQKGLARWKVRDTRPRWGGVYLHGRCLKRFINLQLICSNSFV